MRIQRIVLKKASQHQLYPHNIAHHIKLCNAIQKFRPIKGPVKSAPNTKNNFSLHLSDGKSILSEDGRRRRMKICVIGDGAWGTALAINALENKHNVVMWGAFCLKNTFSFSPPHFFRIRLSGEAFQIPFSLRNSMSPTSELFRIKRSLPCQSNVEIRPIKTLV